MLGMRFAATQPRAALLATYLDAGEAGYPIDAKDAAKLGMMVLADAAVEERIPVIEPRELRELRTDSRAGMQRGAMYLVGAVVVAGIAISARSYA